MSGTETGAGRVAGEVAVVTGGASGIGAAIARALHREGAIVVVADFTGRQEQFAQELGGSAVAAAVDIREAASVEALIASTVDRYGRIDVLCNNAGIDGDIAPVGEASVENFDRVMGTNARGMFLGCHYGVSAMLKTGGGSIINTASISGLVAFPGLSAYAASKGAVIALSRVVAAEYAEQGIRCNALCPGVILTPMLEGVAAKNPAAGEQLSAAAHVATPMSRLGDPKEVAEVALFLASDEASFVTGTAFSVDGGYTAM